MVLVAIAYTVVCVRTKTVPPGAGYLGDVGEPDRIARVGCRGTLPEGWVDFTHRPVYRPLTTAANRSLAFLPISDDVRNALLDTGSKWCTDENVDATFLLKLQIFFPMG